MQGRFAKGIRSRAKVVEEEASASLLQIFSNLLSLPRNLIYPAVINDALFC